MACRRLAGGGTLATVAAVGRRHVAVFARSRRARFSGASSAARTRPIARPRSASGSDAPNAMMELRAGPPSVDATSGRASERCLFVHVILATAVASAARAASTSPGVAMSSATVRTETEASGPSASSVARARAAGSGVAASSTSTNTRMTRQSRGAATGPSLAVASRRAPDEHDTEAWSAIAQSDARCVILLLGVVAAIGCERMVTRDSRRRAVRPHRSTVRGPDGDRRTLLGVPRPAAAAGVPSLTGVAALLAPSRQDSTQAIRRSRSHGCIGDGPMPPPPATAATDAEAGRLRTGSRPDIPAAPGAAPTCASGRTWTTRLQGSPK